MALTPGTEEVNLNEEQLEDDESEDSEEDPNTLRPARISNKERSRQVKKRKRQTIVVFSLLLVVILVIVTLLILVEYHRINLPTTKHPESEDNDLSTSQCHYADQVYPIDQDCGISQCVEHGISQKLTLRSGWNAATQAQLNRTALEMLTFLDEHFNKFPNTLQLIQGRYNDSDVATEVTMKYKNVSILLSSMHMHVEYFCCYDESAYQEIVRLFQTYQWQAFQISFSQFMCLNATDLDQTVYVLLLDEESQETMRNWTDSFEAYLAQNGVELLSTPRRDGQPFHATFAIWDAYNEEMEALSVETIDYLNTHSEEVEWKSMSITFSKENVKPD